VPLIVVAGDDFDESDLLAEDLARAGHDCFVVRGDGFGHAGRRSLSCAESLPLLRGIEMARDFNTAAAALRQATGASKIGIVQQGAPIGLIYAALWPEHVSHLVLRDGSTQDVRFDAADIYCRVMIIDDEHDGAALGDDLVHAQEVRVWRPKRAGQGMFFGRPDLGRNEAMARVLTFLQ